MTKTKFLDFYKEYYGKEMPEDGLCKSFNWDKRIELFKPENAGFYSFWAQSSSVTTSSTKKFNTLRQTIVLFCAAINNEL